MARPHLIDLYREHVVTPASGATTSTPATSPPRRLRLARRPRRFLVASRGGPGGDGGLELLRCHRRHRRCRGRARRPRRIDGDLERARVWSLRRCSSSTSRTPPTSRAVAAELDRHMTAAGRIVAGRAELDRTTRRARPRTRPHSPKPTTSRRRSSPPTVAERAGRPSGRARRGTRRARRDAGDVGVDGSRARPRTHSRLARRGRSTTLDDYQRAGDGSRRRPRASTAVARSSSGSARSAATADEQLRLADAQLAAGDAGRRDRGCRHRQRRARIVGGPRALRLTTAVWILAAALLLCCWR